MDLNLIQFCNYQTPYQSCFHNHIFDKNITGSKVIFGFLLLNTFVSQRVLSDPICIWRLTSPSATIHMRLICLPVRVHKIPLFTSLWDVCTFHLSHPLCIYIRTLSKYTSVNVWIDAWVLLWEDPTIPVYRFCKILW
jgi:hypothetical protein